MLMWIADAPLMHAPDSATACIMIARFGDAEARAAEFLGDGDAEPAGFAHRAVEIVREHAVAVALEPVRLGKLLAQLGDGFADRLLVLGEFKIHVVLFRGSWDRARRSRAGGTSLGRRR